MRRYLAFLLISLASLPTMAAQMWTAQGLCDGLSCGTEYPAVDFQFILIMDDGIFNSSNYVNDPNAFQSFEIIIDPNKDFGSLFDAVQPPVSIGTVQGTFVNPAIDGLGALSLSGTNGFFCANANGLIGTIAPATDACSGLSGPSGVSGTSSINGWDADGQASGSAPLQWIYAGQVPDVVVPVPAAAWLFASALIGLAGIKRRQ